MSASPDSPITGLLRAGAADTPDAIAIVARDRLPLTYGGLWAQVERVVGQLNAFGLGRGDRVAMVLANGPELAVTFLAVAAGATAAPLNPAYGRDELEFYLADLGATALIVDDASADDSPARSVARTRGIPVLTLSPTAGAGAGVFALMGEGRGPGRSAPRPGLAHADETALVLHTSGTTSRPKLVPLTGRNLHASAEHVRAALALTARDRCLNVMPLFHIHGLVAATLASLAAGGSVACTPGFHAPSFFTWLDALRPTWYTAVPTMHQAVLARAGAHPDLVRRAPLRLIRSASAPLPPSVMAELERVFAAPVIEAYGMTEAAHQIASNPLPPGGRKPGSVGVAAGPEVAIVDDAGAPLPPGVRGEVVIRGANVMAGYERNPTANAQTFIGGWLRTGDQGYLDADGYLVLTGRLKEIINRGGEKIAPREVDEVLLDHPAVVQAVTFPVPHATLGEEVAAAVVLRAEHAVTSRELRAFAAARLAYFKVPRQVLVVGEIPKGPTGKLQRIGLAERLGLTTPPGAVSRGPDTDAPHVEPRSRTERGLAVIWSEVLGVDRLGVHDDFFRLGGDSLLAMQCLARARERFAVELSPIALFEAPTIAELAEAVERERNAAPPARGGAADRGR